MKMASAFFVEGQLMHEVVHVEAFPHHGVAVICPDESVWLTVAVRWWDLSTLLWWWLCPADKKAWLILKTADGKKVRTRAVRVAERHLRIGARAKWT